MRNEPNLGVLYYSDLIARIGSEEAATGVELIEENGGGGIEVMLNPWYFAKDLRHTYQLCPTWGDRLSRMRWLYSDKFPVTWRAKWRRHGAIPQRFGEELARAPRGRRLRHAWRVLKRWSKTALAWRERLSSCRRTVFAVCGRLLRRCVLLQLPLQHTGNEDVRLVLREIRRTLKRRGVSMVEMPNKAGLRNLYVQARRGFREATYTEVRYWWPKDLVSFGECIGPTRLEIDGFFTINPQVSETWICCRFGTRSSC